MSNNTQNYWKLNNANRQQTAVIDRLATTLMSKGRAQAATDAAAVCCCINNLPCPASPNADPGSAPHLQHNRLAA
jgi:hypothetical protein